MMQIEEIEIGRLAPHARNARTHTPAQVRQIAQSIREFGFNDPCAIDEHGTIIEGHGRVLAAEALHLTHVPCIVLAHLSDEQQRAYMLAHNKIASNAGWNEGALAAELRELGVDLAHLAGFADWELKALDDGSGAIRGIDADRGRQAVVRVRVNPGSEARIANMLRDYLAHVDGFVGVE